MSKVTHLPQPCPICGDRTQLTFEDIVPTWLRKETLQLSGRSGQLPPRVKLRICRDCNEELGRRFESPLSPLLKRMVIGDTVMLDSAAQGSIGAWIAKTSLLSLLMREQMSSDVVKSATAVALRRLIETRTLSFPASVRLFHVSPTLQSEAALRRVVPGGKAPYPVGAYAVSFFGQFGYEFFNATSELVEGYARATGQHARSVTISPLPLSPVVWPPRRTTSQADLLALRTAYSDRRDADLAPASSRDG